MTPVCDSVGMVAGEQRYTHQVQQVLRTRLGQGHYGQSGKGVYGYEFSCVCAAVYTGDREGAFDILSCVTDCMFGLWAVQFVCSCVLVRRASAVASYSVVRTLPSAELERLNSYSNVATTGRREPGPA